MTFRVLESVLGYQLEVFGVYTATVWSQLVQGFSFCWLVLPLFYTVHLKTYNIIVLYKKCMCSTWKRFWCVCKRLQFPGGGGHSLIWPIRGRAAVQGMVFGLLCPEQGIQFYANLSQTVSEPVLNRACFFKIVVKNRV